MSNRPVSATTIRTASAGRPRSSATTCWSTVYAPAPCSKRGVVMSTEPSRLHRHLRVDASAAGRALADGDAPAHAGPPSARCSPTPRPRLRAASAARFSTNTSPSAVGSPSSTRFIRRNCTGSMPSALATSSMCDSRGEDGLRLARPAHVPARRVVGVDHVLHHARVFRSVGSSRRLRAAEVPRWLEARVRAAVEHDGYVVRGDRAVLPDAGAHPQPGVVARVRGQELLRVVEHHPHRPAAHRLREHVAQRDVHRRALAAEVAADGDRVEDDALRLDAERPRDLRAHRVRRLAGRPHLRGAVRVDAHRRVVRLHVRLVLRGASCTCSRRRGRPPSCPPPRRRCSTRSGRRRSWARSPRTAGP